MKKILFVLLASISLLACGTSADDFVSAGLDSYVQVEPGFQTLNDNEATGNGSLRFLNVLPSLSGRSISIKGTLNQLTGGQISVIMYSSSANVSNSTGVNIRFTRQGTTVNGAIAINGNEVAMSPSRLSFYYPANLDLTIEVHNTGSRSRVLIWRNDLMTYTAATADIDTLNSNHINGTLPTQTASGGFVGLRLNQATVTRFRVALPKVLP